MATPDPALDWRMIRRNRSRIVGDRIASCRRELGWSQERLADEMTAHGFRMTQATVSRAESGAGVDEIELIYFSLVFGVTVTYLLGLTEEKKRWRPDADAMKDAATRVFFPGEGPLSPVIPLRPTTPRQLRILHAPDGG